MDVAATSSRLTKVARIAALLHRAAPDTQLVTIIVSWLSGELPQRHIGVGWAALRSLPPPAPQPALTVTGVDATLSKIGTLSGKGSQAQRAALVAELFSAATEAEQTFLLRLLGGELRQGAKGGIMADAVAQAAGLPAATVQRAAMLGGDLAAAAAAGLSGAALDTFTLRVGRPIGPMLAQTATSVHDALERHGGTTIFEAKLDGARVQIHRANDQVRIYTRSLDDVTARLPEVVEATLALPVRDLVADGRRSRCARTTGRSVSRSPHHGSADRSMLRLPARRSHFRCSSSTSCIGMVPTCSKRRPPSGWPPWTHWCRLGTAWTG